MKNGKLYNIMFPVWFLLMFPITWLVILPANFIIDTVVIIAGLVYLKVNKVYDTYKKIILKVWLLGFIANAIGCSILLLHKGSDSLYHAFSNRIVWNPYSSLTSILYVVIAILVSMILLYIFNYKISFTKVGLERKKAKKLAAMVAIMTAPWILLFPTHKLYDGMNLNITMSNSEITNDAKSLEIRNALNELDMSEYIESGVYDYRDLKLSVRCNITDDVDKTDDYKVLFESDDTDKILGKSASKLFDKIEYINDVVFKVSDDKTYNFSRNK